MAILKLKAAGESHTMTIKGCEVAKGQYGEQVKFDGTDGNTLYLPKESADRQLARCGFIVEDDEGSRVDYGAVEGNALTFSRDPNPKPGSSPFWSIAVATPADLKAKPPTKRLTAADASTAPEGPAKDAGAPPSDDLDAKHQAERDRLEGLYWDLWRRSAAFQEALCSKSEITEGPVERIPFDAASINAMASTVMIQWERRGLV